MNNSKALGMPFTCDACAFEYDAWNTQCEINEYLKKHPHTCSKKVPK